MSYAPDDLSRFGPEDRIPIGPEVSDAVWHRDRGVCQLCGREVHDEDWEVDHHIPYSLVVARGGTPEEANAVWNLQVAHRLCNMVKGGARILRVDRGDSHTRIS